MVTVLVTMSLFLIATLQMKVFFLAIFTLFSFNTFSQQYPGPTDQIYLNDSITIYNGLIVEQAPAKYVKIARTKEKDTIRVLMKDIWKMVRLYPVQDTLKTKTETKTSRIANKNTYAYLEMLGSAGIYSFNYDFRFMKDVKNKWGLRVGIAYLPINTVNYSGDLLQYTTFLFPFMVNYLIGKKNKFLELALGAVYVFKKRNGKLLAEEYEYFIRNINRRIPNAYGAFSIGYRRHPTKGKIMWGISLTPLIGNSFTIPNIGFKLGYHIK
jgi:hypothetical protein